MGPDLWWLLMGGTWPEVNQTSSSRCFFGLFNSIYQQQVLFVFSVTHSIHSSCFSPSSDTRFVKVGMGYVVEGIRGAGVMMVRMRGCRRVGRKMALASI